MAVVNNEDEKYYAQAHDKKLKYCISSTYTKYVSCTKTYTTTLIIFCDAFISLHKKDECVLLLYKNISLGCV